uniref:Uncharacterized protein n=1 Tax=Ditylenchus dipsaci TaxID=166011 RepID=A0A915DU72_9BILA
MGKPPGYPTRGTTSIPRPKYTNRANGFIVNYGSEDENEEIKAPRKLKSYTAEFKLKVIKHAKILEQGGQQEVWSGSVALLLRNEAESSKNISNSISPPNGYHNDCQEDGSIEEQHDFIVTDDFSNNSSLFIMMGCDLAPQFDSPYENFKRAMMENFIEETMHALGTKNIDKYCLDILYMQLNWGSDESIEQNMEDAKGALNKSRHSEEVLHKICRVASQISTIVRARNIKEIVTKFGKKCKKYLQHPIQSPKTYELPSVSSSVEATLVRSLQTMLQKDIQLNRMNNIGLRSTCKRVSRESSESPTQACPSNEFSSVALIEFVQSSIPDGPTVLKYLLALVRSLESDLAIQNEMIDLLGMKNIDLVEKILANRKVLAEELNENFMRCKKLRKQINQGVNVPSNPIVGGNIVLQSESGLKSRKRMMKEEKKMKKELGKVVGALSEVERLQFEEAQRDALKQKELELANKG